MSPDPLGIIIGVLSVLALVALFIGCEALGNGNVGADK